MISWSLGEKLESKWFKNQQSKVEIYGELSSSKRDVPVKVNHQLVVPVSQCYRLRYLSMTIEQNTGLEEISQTKPLQVEQRGEKLVEMRDHQVPLD